MSYDLAVFDPRPELRDYAAFLSWFQSRTRWADALDYRDIANATPALQAWFGAIVDVFPLMRAPDRPGMDGTQRLVWETDYSIGNDIIYAAFRSSKAAVARDTALRLAAKHHVGLYEVSEQGEIWFPTPAGVLDLVHSSKRPAFGGRDYSEAIVDKLEEHFARIRRERGST